MEAALHEVQARGVYRDADVRLVLGPWEALRLEFVE